MLACHLDPAAAATSAPSAKTGTPSSARIDALIARMTLEEKAGQLTLYPDAVRPSPRPVNPDMDAERKRINDRRIQLEQIRQGKVGALVGGSGVAEGIELQKAALSSRLGIPLLFGADVVHGFRTIFPIPLGMGASFDPELARRAAQVAAVEANAAGIHWTYAPMVDVARDQRWGRVAEGAGEDTFLTSQFARAYVQGFQGQDLTREGTVVSTPKHFAGYGAVIGGMEYNTTALSERTLREVFLPPFKAAVDAGALSIMSGFNDVDGVPATGNHHLLTDILRGEWGFPGFVVSDALSVEELVTNGVATDNRDAARMALRAGLDMSMGSGLYTRYLPDLVRSGAVPERELDQAVRRVLEVKQALGLFDNPFRALVPADAGKIRSPEHLALARQAAREAIVLLKNQGQLLPLQGAARVALIGPLGDDADNLNGPWAPWGKSQESITLATGLRQALGAGAGSLEVVKGSEVDQEIAGGIARAVAAAQGADVVLLALGEGADMSGESASRVDIGLPAAQVALATAVMKTGTPVVVLLSSGRALALPEVVQQAPAILANWFLGSESGPALADVLLGKVSPSGRLPVSFPRVSGQEPFYYDHMTTGRPQAEGAPAKFTARYIEVPNSALYPFGYGLTYGHVEYGAPSLSSTQMAWDGAITVRATLHNAGTVAVVETPQLYVQDVVASVVRPVRQLRGFKRVTLPPGGTATVEFRLQRADLEFVGRDLKTVAEPGRFRVWLAPSSAAGQPLEFDLVGA